METNLKESTNSYYIPRGAYSSITIEGFRSFKEITLEGFSQINLILGNNNVGKTSILEAIYTHCCGLHFVPFLNNIILRRHNNTILGIFDYGEKLISLFRNTSSTGNKFTISASLEAEDLAYTLNSSFFPSFDISALNPKELKQVSKTMISNTESQISRGQQIHINGGFAFQVQQPPPPLIGEWNSQLNDKNHNFKIYLTPPQMSEHTPFKYAFFHDVLSHRYPNTEQAIFGYLKRFNLLEKFTHEMQKAFPEVQRIDMIPYPDGSQGPIYIETYEGKLLPIHTFGDGVRRWFYLLGNLLLQSNSCHCVEEIDVCFHKSSQIKLSRLLTNYAVESQNQIFMTSHNIEFVDYFLESLYGEDGLIKSKELDPVRVFTIKPSSTWGSPNVWSLTGFEAYNKRQNFELELR
jgi:hypothetical protein